MIHIPPRRYLGTIGAIDLTVTGPMGARPHYLGSTPAENRPRVLGGRDTGGVVFPPTLGDLQASTLASASSGGAPAGAPGGGASSSDGCGCG